MPGAFGCTAALDWCDATSAPSAPPSAILPKSLRHVSPRKGVKLIIDSPLHFLPRLRPQIDEGLRTDGGADGPENQLRHGPVRRLPHADARLPVLNPDIVIARRVAEAVHLREHRLALLQLFQVGEMDRKS